MTVLNCKQAALALGQSERTVQLAVQNNKYTHWYVPGKGRGGRQLQIALESLPAEAIARYHGIQREQDTEAYLHLTADQRREVDHKHAVVHQYKDFKTTYLGRDKMVAFLQQHNAEHPERTAPLTRRQLNHWESCFDREGMSGLPVLLL